MKLFRIGEISKLYNVSVDTLRHYEKLGILVPEQMNDSGYRYYSNYQISKLNIIRTLRKLDIGLNEIREFMVDRTLDKSEALIRLQIEVIKEKQKILSLLSSDLEKRLQYLTETKKIATFDEIEIKKLPSRNAIISEQKANLVWDVDRIHKELEVKIKGHHLSYLAWGRAGAILSEADFANCNYTNYSRSFILDSTGDFIIPEGDFICLYFRGQHNNETINKSYKMIKHYLNLNSYSIKGPVLEIYRFDIHETDIENEFLTEIQVPISKNTFD